MKHWTIVIGAVCVLLAVAGCERRRPPAGPAAYDPDIDAIPSVLVSTPDANLLADQRKIAAEAARRSLRETPAGRTEPPKARTPLPGGPTEAPALPAAGDSGSSAQPPGGGEPVLSPARKPAGPAGVFGEVTRPLERPER